MHICIYSWHTDVFCTDIRYNKKYYAITQYEVVFNCKFINSDILLQMTSKNTASSTFTKVNKILYLNLHDSYLKDLINFRWIMEFLRFHTSNKHCHNFYFKLSLFGFLFIQGQTFCTYYDATSAVAYILITCQLPLQSSSVYTLYHFNIQ